MKDKETFVYYWIKNTPEDIEFPIQDVVFEVFHNFVALSQWGHFMYRVMDRLREDGCQHEEGVDPEAIQELRQAYQTWPFLQATIDNAALALSKTDVGIVRRYADLAEEFPDAADICELIAEEFERSREAILQITDKEHLLDDIPWLQTSIATRNPFIDPLHMIQIELLRRLRAADEDTPEALAEEWSHLARLSIQGIAAGMRTTG